MLEAGVPVRTTAGEEPLDRLEAIAFLSFLVAIVAAGPIRWGLSLAGATPLAYLPQALLLLAIARRIKITLTGTHPVSASFLICLVLAGFAGMLGVVNLGAQQALFGVFTLTPLIFSLTCHTTVLRLIDRFPAGAFAFWLAATGGVYVQWQIDYPWTGLSYELGGVEIEAAREWWVDGGVSRLAGLSRSSFDAAAQIVILAAISALQMRNRAVRVLIWSLSLGAVWLTTSKGFILAMATVTPGLLAGGSLGGWLLARTAGLMVIVVVVVPLTTLYPNLYDSLYDPTFTSSSASFADRLVNTWPEAWELIASHGFMGIGRGFGGVGVPTSLFDPDRFNPADNLFVYLAVSLGLAGVILYLALAHSILRAKADTVPLHTWGVFVAIITYGLTANVVELAMLALFLGATLRALVEAGAAHEHAVGKDHPLNHA